MRLIQDALGRTEDPLPINEPLLMLMDKRIMVTGAQGSLGMALINQLVLSNLTIWLDATDMEQCDVREFRAVERRALMTRPDVIFHLAGAKHAPAGEEDPMATAETNVQGTYNVLHAAHMVGAHVVTASTCKACDPETAYGASKLIAERLTLNAGGCVARFYNVVETSGNVFELWEKTRQKDPIPYTDCHRFFMSKREAVSLLLWAAQYRGARLAFDPGLPRPMKEVAMECYPTRTWTEIRRRRGDRQMEPRKGRSETMTRIGDTRLARITSPHDSLGGYRAPQITVGGIPGFGDGRASPDVRALP